MGRSLRRWIIRLIVTFVLLVVGVVAVYRVVPPPVTPLMLLREAPITRQWVPYDAIASNLVRAVIAAEDNRFCTHWGVDWNAYSAAIAAFIDGNREGGGSTITMQAAKNLFLWPERSVVRKALELPLTLLIEGLWPKRRILEVYLNVVEWDDGIYGVEAAARHHFGKSAAVLTRREAARLAATLPNPRDWHAGRPSAFVRERAAVIDRRVTQLGPLLDCV